MMGPSPEKIFDSSSRCQRVYLGYPSSSAGKESTCNTGDPSSIPGSERSPGEGTGNPLQYSYRLKNLTDRGAWWATVHAVAKSRT